MITVGAVMATYNGEKFLQEQTDSIIRQTHPLQQIVIVDDCSQDRTRQIMADYMNKHPGLIRFAENEENLGPKKTFEKGLSLCNTDYIALSDQDDVWQPNKIENMLEVLAKNREAKLCFHDLKIINSKGDIRAKSYWGKTPKSLPLPVLGRSARERLASFSNPVPGCTMFFEASLKEQILPMPLSDVGHDWWISAVAFFGADPMQLEETLAKYRLHPNQISGIGTTLKKNKDERKIYPVHLRIAREIRRVIFNKRLKREKERTMNMNRYALSSELIKIIDKCLQTNLFQDRKDEYKMIKKKMMRNLEIYSQEK